MHDHHGGCHCGNLRWTLRTGFALHELPAHACQCSFCRRHGALSSSDPEGEVRFTIADTSAIMRYRFERATADFLICARCGVYVGAQMEDAGRYYAIVNLCTLENAAAVEYIAQPMDYSGEDSVSRRARRAKGWTPLTAPA